MVTIKIDPNPCPICHHFACICTIQKEHDPDCRFARSATCSVGIECEHGRDVCPICDPCTCGTRPKQFLAWAIATFGEIARDGDERVARFIEEAVELAHASGMDAAMLGKIVERVYGRPRGNLFKEIGQSQATLEVLAESLGTSSDALAAAEFERVKSISKDEWKRRHDAKVALGIASN